MSELVRIIDEYRDDHGGMAEAAVARMIGVPHQTINSWRRRGVRGLPGPATLRAMSDALRVPYERVLAAAEVDAGYRDTMPPRPPKPGPERGAG